MIDNCPVCPRAVGAAREWVRGFPEEQLVVLLAGERNPYAGEDVVAAEIPEGGLSERFEIEAAPFGLLLDQEGTVLAKGIVNQATDLDRPLASSPQNGADRIGPVMSRN